MKAAAVGGGRPNMDSGSSVVVSPKMLHILPSRHLGASAMCADCYYIFD